MSKISVAIKRLEKAGIEVLPRGPGHQVGLPRHTVLEAPGSLKWTNYEHSIELGAFSYQVSGYCFAARIGRYCSFGEDVQIGRQNHPMTWVSTSPAFYLGDQLFNLGNGFKDAQSYHNYKFNFEGPPTRVKITNIGNDVWIGHGAMVLPGVTVGNGVIIGAGAVVARDVAPYSVVAGNPGQVLRPRFEPQVIALLQALRWWDLEPEQIRDILPVLASADADALAALVAQIRPEHG